MRYWLIPVLFCFISCTSIDELVEAGRYDDAIDKGLKTLRKTPNDHTAKKSVLQAYKLAQEKDLNRIEAVKSMEASPLNFEQIHRLCIQRERRAYKLYQAELLVEGKWSKLKVATEVALSDVCRANVASAEEKMMAGVRTQYREAYNDWLKVKKYGCNHSSIDSIMIACGNKGKAVVLIQIDEQPGTPIPIDTERRLRALYNHSTMLGNWTQMTHEIDPKVEIHYVVGLSFNQIKTGDNQQTKKTTSHEKKIKVGTRSAKDANGKTIQVPVYQTVKAKFTAYHLFKTSSQGLMLTVISNENKTTKHKKQINGKYSFNHSYYTYSGDKRALSSDQVKKLKTKPQKFPSKSQMVRMSGKQLAEQVDKYIRRNSSLFY